MWSQNMRRMLNSIGNAFNNGAKLIAEYNIVLNLSIINLKSRDVLIFASFR